MKRKLFGFLRSDRRGLALISVLGVVTLTMILILALFSVSDSEFKASRVYEDGSTAHHLADNAINIVMGQIQAAATGAGTPGAAAGSAPLGSTIWASQPGAVRVYNSSGNFILGRTLFSSSQMVYHVAGIAGEQQMADYAPSANWSANPDQWVDLNKPVSRVKLGIPEQVYFPIFDPRSTNVAEVPGPPEGFQILDQTTGAGSHKVSSAALGVIVAGATNKWRLPMPVEWLYVLKDGTVGTVAATGAGAAQWVAASGKAGPTEDNPIIGRVGFWTDDECCKININTAGEPGYWSAPAVMHERDHNWADCPPAIFEYQRFPGHPATVALSSVFSPGFDPNAGLPGTSPNSVFKNALYDFAPRLAPGGSADGTVPFATDQFKVGLMDTGASTDTATLIGTLATGIMAAKTKPFYASVDEALFNTTMVNQQRGLRVVTSPVAGVNLLSPAMLERSRSFLTAHSRAPETNMFGLPRVAIWPVPDTSSPPGGQDWHAYRTGYDTAVATCAKLGSLIPTAILTETQNSYYFRRLDPSSHLTDMGKDSSATGQSGLARNANLMSYLDNLIKMTMPGGQSLYSKYAGYGGNDAEQVLVEIFDYIRCTNLYDGFLSDGDGSALHKGYPAETRDNTLPLKLDMTKTAGDTPGLLWDQAPKRNQYFTYTAPRFKVLRSAGSIAAGKGADAGLGGALQSDQNNYNQNPEYPMTGAYPGHGQVKPIEWNAPDSGTTLKGFGRFPTISEVALQFICTGDGLHDAGSYKVKTPLKTFYSGGKTAERIDTGNYQTRRALVDGRGTRYYYSNIPPFPDADLFTLWGCNMAHAYKGTPDDPALHPAWNAFNWNCTLDYNNSNKSGIPLAEGEKRIQICLLIETFVPAVGYTKYVPDYTLVLKGEQVSGIKVMDATGAWKSVFSTTGPQVVQSTYAFVGDTRGLNSNNDISPLGGSFGPSAITAGRQVIAIGKMPNDPSYQPQATGSAHAQMLNFPLVSNFLTVKRTDANGKPATLQFKVEKPLEVDIYAAHDWQGVNPGHSVPSQRVNVQFPSGPQSTPVPHLVVYSTEPREYTDTNGNYVRTGAIPCVRWWSFNYGGAINRYQGTGLANGNAVSWKGVLNVVENQPSGNMTYTYGRFHPTNVTSVLTRDPHNRGVVGAGSNGIAVPAGGLIYGYSPISPFSGVMSDPNLDLPNVDVYVPGSTANDMGRYEYYGTDSVRSIIPRHGDYRLLAARKVVDSTIWDKHPVWKNQPNALFAHSLSGAYSDSTVGFDMGGLTATTINPQYRLVPNAWYESSSGTDPDLKTGRFAVVPDTPLTAAAAAGSSRFRDFDNGIGNLRDGAYINKPDDGNLSVLKFYHASSTLDTTSPPAKAGFYLVRNAYFSSSFLQLPSKGAFFTPNRIISSPGMFGSLPTGVWGSQSSHSDLATKGNAKTDGIPWRTLLFRADVDGHVGAASWSGGVAGGGADPADHYFMDLFFMPIVEPYAITDSYSTAGKINLNYQILPFTNIKRATAVWAAMKGEMITAFSSKDTDPRKPKGLPPSATNTAIYKKIKNVNTVPPSLWTETGTDNINWHRKIDVAETVKQMDERFAFTSAPNAVGNVGLMLAPSQVCELHLIPKIVAGTERPGEPVMTNLVGESRKQAMAAFWAHNDLTGDNTRERPYANLYQKFTTRSNTFRVFFTAQTLKKARSLPPNQVDTRKDSITAEYRGSALFERYLDFSQAGAAKLAAQDYGNGLPLAGRPTLEDSYHYRVIEMKQFSP